MVEKNTALKPGCVVCKDKAAIYVQTGDGLLKIKEVQLEGKKRMDMGAFLRGYQIEEGMILQ